MKGTRDEQLHYIQHCEGLVRSLPLNVWDCIIVCIIELLCQLCMCVCMAIIMVVLYNVVVQLSVFKVSLSMSSICYAALKRSLLSYYLGKFCTNIVNMVNILVIMLAQVGNGDLHVHESSALHTSHKLSLQLS